MKGLKTVGNAYSGLGWGKEFIRIWRNQTCVYNAVEEKPDLAT